MYYHTNKALKTHLQQFFPNGHTHYASDPFNHAMKHKGEAGKRQINGAPVQRTPEMAAMAGSKRI